MSSLADGHGSYADLASAQAEGTDYRVHVLPFAGSSIAVIAPHGGPTGSRRRTGAGSSRA
ncbi:poly-gamma-glutamate hydrolase family protein [Ottowia sp.]|uniref:poly-gamma-glutamate hydrolase family protein n=1 Tax=Ottowia sp. TaxID=1898956 RepID=UPI0034555206|nr:poly-gamma-glutamate hydrolase family protein [Ottowia sp.]